MHVFALTAEFSTGIADVKWHDTRRHAVQVAPGLNERPLYDALAPPDTSCYMAPGLFTAAEAVKDAMQVGWPADP